MKKTTLLPPHFLQRHAYLCAALGLFAAVAFGPRPARAAVTEAWVHRYSSVVSNSNDQAVKIVSDAVGNIIVTGTTEDTSGSDMLTIKYSGMGGSVLWQQRYNATATNSAQPNAIAVDGNGNVVVTGYSYANFNIDYYTAKYAAADGALLWEKRYDGPANNDDQARAVAVDASGNVAVTGYSHNGTNYDYYTAKYAAADGALLWEKRYNGPVNYYEYATAVAVDGSGNVVVTGSSYNESNSDYYTAKYAAADGALLWEKRYNSPANSDYAHAVAVDGSGNVVVTGVAGDSYGYSGDYYTAKYAAANGAVLWEKRYNGPANSHDVARAVVVDSSGNVVVTGSSAHPTNSDYYTAKYAAADGALIWEKRYSGPANSQDEARGVVVDGVGNVVVTGSSYNGTNDDYYTAKYAAVDGALVWEKHYNSPANSEDSASAIAADGQGNVVVTGSSMSRSYNDFYTAKYAAADGALLWEKRYNGPAERQDFAKAVVVDGSGNVVVTGVAGYSYAFPSGDYYTAKYAGTDGALLWEKSYQGPADNYSSVRAVVDGTGNVVVTSLSFTTKYAGADGVLLWEKLHTNTSASAAAVDRESNVVVTRSSHRTNYNYDYYTAKYAALDGTLLWEKCYNGPAGSYDSATSLAVDGTGNVVVTGSFVTAKYAGTDGALLWEKVHTNASASAVAVDRDGNVVVIGSSRNGAPNYDADYYTAKYAAADGALLWERRYNGPANSCDFAIAVAVDGWSNVVVTGFSSTRECYYDQDYYTAKYAAADGALLWEKRYNGPANLSDRASGVAVDSSGNVVVTGSTDSDEYPGGITDYYTVKYAAADGSVLWESRYNGPANGQDGATSLAVGPNGMVVVTGFSAGDAFINYDYATVVYRENLPPVSIALVPSGIRLRFASVPGHNYTVERASAVIGPWTSINTQTAPASGLLEYLDASSPPGQAFYRTVQP